MENNVPVTPIILNPTTSSTISIHCAISGCYCMNIYIKVFIWLPGIKAVQIKHRTQTTEALFCLNQREIRHSHFILAHNNWWQYAFLKNGWIYFILCINYHFSCIFFFKEAKRQTQQRLSKLRQMVWSCFLGLISNPMKLELSYFEGYKSYGVYEWMVSCFLLLTCH